MRGKLWVLSCAASLALASANAAMAQTAYGVNAAGNLFSFDVTTPANVTTIGPVGFVPEGIDFRPGTNSLYAIDIGTSPTALAQLYTINIATGAATAVGAGFPTVGTGYNLSGNQSFGFDFNPTTLQQDNSMRIRLVSTNTVNMRLNSATGQPVTPVDTNLAFSNGNSPFIDGAAYINNLPNSGGSTTLYDMDSRNDVLVIQNPPNAGTVTTVGAFGVTVDAQSGIGFDVYTDPTDADPSIAGDHGFAVLKRPDAPVNGPLGAYLLYDVNLGTGQITNGALVGSSQSPFDFDGGFAVLPGNIPEPTALGALTLGAVMILRRSRRD